MLNYSINVQNYNDWWELVPIPNEKNTYFKAKLQSINVSTTKTKIIFDTKILINTKNILPKNSILMSLSIPEYEVKNLSLIPIEIENLEDEWKSYQIYVQIPKNKLSYGDQDLQNITVPIRMGFYCNEAVINPIKNNLNPEALRYWLDNLYDAVISSEVRLDSNFRIYSNYGKVQLYESFPTNLENEGKLFDLSWNSKSYMQLKRLDMIKDLTSIIANIPLIISNTKIDIYYNVSETSEYKSLTYSDNRSYHMKENETNTIQLPFKVMYDESKKILYKDPIGGHDFLLPEGGFGYYNVSFDLQTKNTFYIISLTNKFNYYLPFNDYKKVDFFIFDYQEINDLTGFKVL